MNKIQHCVWLPEWPRWRYLAHCVLRENSALFVYNKSFTDQAGWILALIFFLPVYGTQLHLGP